MQGSSNLGKRRRSFSDWISGNGWEKLQIGLALAIQRVNAGFDGVGFEESRHSSAALACGPPECEGGSAQAR